MKKICIFLLVLCLGLHTPALLAQASGGEDMEETKGQEQNSTLPEEIQQQNDVSSSPTETQAQENRSAPEEEQNGTAAQVQSTAQELPEKAAPGEKLPGKEVAESILGRIAQSELTAGETTGAAGENAEVTAGENPGDETMPATGDSIGITAPSAVLMEASTGTIVLEKNAHEKLHPASVTKIMTLLLIFDAISQGKIKLEDSVTTSAYAASMGGSQVFLEEGETQSVDTMIKCISVASANDASVAYRYSRRRRILAECTFFK